ncbi:hypothetical protein, partial [Salmonella enterica]|uniref:hypothetical protein n=1 Tax=Salmonella enterica TaxID=28901 RepID=UPI0032989DBC
MFEKSRRDVIGFFVFLRCDIVQFQRTTNKLNGNIIVRNAEACMQTSALVDLGRLFASGQGQCAGAAH